MEFDLASNMTSGPSIPILEESILKDYTSEVMDGLALTSVSPYDFIPFDLTSVHQGFMNIYLHVVESASTRNLAGAGIIAAAVIYAVWKTNDGWSKHFPPAAGSGSAYDLEGCRRKGIDAVEDRPEERPLPVSEEPPVISYLPKYPQMRDSTVYCRLFQSKGTDTEGLVTMSESFHRQLKDALSRLEDVQFKLKELEKDKKLLSTEIDVRKQMIHKLQSENNAEREKRQKAELKMEVMDMENSQIRQLRKEVDLKSSQVEKLETLMKEKDDMQMKLFENNIVLPRNVVEARAREFSELQNRVLQLQAEMDSSRRFRDCDLECQPCGLSKSLWLESSLRLPALRHNEILATAKKSYHNGSPITLSQSFHKKLPNTKLRLAERSPTVVRQKSRSIEKAVKLSAVGPRPSLTLHSKTAPDGKPTSNMCESKSATNTSVSSLSTPARGAELLDGNSSLRRKNNGVFAQIRALVGNFRDSNSENNSANLAILKDLGSLLNSHRPRNNCLTNKENPQSDEQSGIFMSASGGSDDSDIDEFGVQGKHEGKSRSKKMASLKRLSRYRRKRRDNVFIKKRLAVQYFGGQAHLIGLREASALSSLSREQSHGSLAKHYPITAETTKSVAESRDGDLSCSVSALKIRDKNNGHGGDSWILIIPKRT